MVRSLLTAFAALAALAAVGALALDWSAAGDGAFRLRPLGEVWFRLHKDSWLLLQPAIERHVSPALWTWVVEPIALQPAAAVLAVKAAALFGLSRVAKPRRA